MTAAWLSWTASLTLRCRLPASPSPSLLSVLTRSLSTLSDRTAQLEAVLDAIDSAHEQQQVQRSAAARLLLCAASPVAHCPPAVLCLQLLSALSSARTQLSAFRSQHGLNVEAADQLVADWADIADEQREIDDVLSTQPAGGAAGGDEADALAELAELEAELQQEEQQKQQEQPGSTEAAPQPAASLLSESERAKPVQRPTRTTQQTPTVVQEQT